MRSEFSVGDFVRVVDWHPGFDGRVGTIVGRYAIFKDADGKEFVADGTTSKSQFVREEFDLELTPLGSGPLEELTCRNRDLRHVWRRGSEK